MPFRGTFGPGPRRTRTGGARRMMTIAAGMRYVDVRFRQMPLVIATAVLDSPSGVALIDPGPSSCLPAGQRRTALWRGDG